MGKGRKRKDAKSATSQVNSGPKATQAKTGAIKEKTKELKGKSQPKSGVSSLLLIFAVLVALMGIFVYIALPEQRQPDNPITFRVIPPEKEEKIHLGERAVKKTVEESLAQDIQFQGRAEHEEVAQSVQDQSTPSTENFKDVFETEIKMDDLRAEEDTDATFGSLEDDGTSKTDFTAKEPAEYEAAEEQLLKHSKEGKTSEGEHVADELLLEKEDQSDLLKPENIPINKDIIERDNLDVTSDNEEEHMSNNLQLTDATSVDIESDLLSDVQNTKSSSIKQDTVVNDEGVKEYSADSVTPEQVSGITDNQINPIQLMESVDFRREALSDGDTTVSQKLDKAVEIDVEQEKDNIGKIKETKNMSADVEEADNVIKPGIGQTGADVEDILPENGKFIGNEVDDVKADQTIQPEDDAQKMDDDEKMETDKSSTDTRDITLRTIQHPEEISSIINTQSKGLDAGDSTIKVDESDSKKTGDNVENYDENNATAVSDVQMETTTQDKETKHEEITKKENDFVKDNVEEIKSEMALLVDDQQHDMTRLSSPETKVDGEAQPESFSIEKPRDAGESDDKPALDTDIQTADFVTDASKAIGKESEQESDKHIVQNTQGLLDEERNETKQAKDGSEGTKQLEVKSDVINEFEDKSDITKQIEEVSDETQQTEDKSEGTLLDNKEERVENGGCGDVSDDDEEEKEEEEEEEDVPPAYHVDEERVIIDFQDDSRYTEVATGVRKRTLRNGVGPLPEKGDIVTVHCVGYLDQLPLKKFWSTRDLAQRPFKFAIGLKQVIKGWDEGAASMRFNEKSRIKIKSEKAYGKFGFEAWDIPPDADLMFEMEVIEIKRVKAR